MLWIAYTIFTKQRRPDSPKTSGTWNQRLSVFEDVDHSVPVSFQLGMKSPVIQLFLKLNTSKLDRNCLVHEVQPLSALQSQSLLLVVYRLPSFSGFAWEFKQIYFLLFFCGWISTSQPSSLPAQSCFLTPVIKTRFLQMPLVLFINGTKSLSLAETLILMQNFSLASQVSRNLLNEEAVQYSKRHIQTKWAIFPLKQVRKHLLPSLS